MKTFLIILSLTVFNACTAQIQIPEDNITIAQYPNFYNQTVQKMNNIIPNKTYYYGKPLSVFLTALSQNNIIIKSYEPAPYNNKLMWFTFLWNRDVYHQVLDLDYVEPEIFIYFQQSFSYPQATVIFNNDYHSYWNLQAENFYKNLIIEKIEFRYVNGLTDKTSPPR